MKMHTLEKEDIQESNRAALFPALSEGSKEKRAVSILLACMEQVPELARTLLQGQGVPFGKRSRLRRMDRSRTSWQKRICSTGWQN